MDITLEANSINVSTNYRSGTVSAELSGINLDTEELAKKVELSTIFEAHGEDAIKQFGIENYGWEFEE